MQVERDKTRTDRINVRADNTINHEMSSHELLHDLQQRIAGGARRIVIDFTDVPIITTVSIALLVKVHTELEQKGGNLYVLHLSEMARDVLKVARLDHLLHIAEE